jgi:hypothetical protein
MAAIPRLLDKGLIKVVGLFEGGNPAYAATPIGRAVALMIKSLPVFKPDPPKQEDSGSTPS